MITKEHLSRLDDVDIEYRCERCWSEKDINLYPKSLFLKKGKGFVILCERCRNEAPQGATKETFEDLFLKFSSPKELIKHYNVNNEVEALESWCKEKGVENRIFEDKVVSESPTEEIIVDEDSHIPFGYEVVEGHLNIKSEEADEVKKIYESYLSGNTMEWISRNLGSERKLSVGFVREILKNPIYAGYIFKGKEIVKGGHESIVDRETFNKVQQRIMRNIRNPKYLYKPLILEQ